MPEGGVGRGVGVSLQPINSSLTKHLREISHAPLAPCTENQRRGPPEKGIPYGQTGNTTPDEGQHMVLEESDSNRKLLNSEGHPRKGDFDHTPHLSMPLLSFDHYRLVCPDA